MKILVTIPAYNEEKTIGKVIYSIFEAYKGKPDKIMVQVIDDGSKDQTVQITKKLGAKVVSHKRNMGLGKAFSTEMVEALKEKPDVIVHFDADGQYLAKDIPRMVAEVQKGYDLVLGSRFMGHIESMPTLKRMGNIAFSLVLSQICKAHITDGQTGFRAFTPEVAKEISIQSEHTYTQEQLIRAYRQGYRVKEIPVYFAKRDGKSRLISNPFEYASKAWINILRIYRDYEPLKFFGGIGLSMFGVGFLIGLYILYKFIQLGRIGQVPLTLFGVLLMTVGLQVILFGFLADMQKK